MDTELAPLSVLTVGAAKTPHLKYLPIEINNDAKDPINQCVDNQQQPMVRDDDTITEQIDWKWLLAETLTKMEVEDETALQL